MHRTLLILALIVTPFLLGSTVRATSVAQMMIGSELVFEGRVTEITSQSDSANRMIFTLVTFEVVDVIKGSLASPNIVLRFLGGSVGDRSLDVADMKFPVLHEHGIYFVESLSRHQAHPFFGWSQGHLRVVQDSSGERRVFARDGTPILQIEDQAGAPTGTSTDLAAGFVADPLASPEAAMRLETFKQALRRLAAPPAP